MDGNLPKVSFIPKSPLARPESFMERRRPRSVIGVTAAALFIVNVGVYAGLYVYERSLTTEIGMMTDKIEAARRTLAQAPEINEAKVFRVRADLAKALLDRHIVASPVFDFIQQNTLQSIYYNDFSFKQNKDMWTLDLAGEAPGYASLAYQADVLRQKKDTIVDFGISDVSLTKFGTVTFNLSITFGQKALSYNMTYAGASAATTPTVPAAPGAFTITPPTAPVVPTTPAAPTLIETATGTPSGATQATTTTEASAPGWSVTPVTEAPAASGATTPAPVKQSWWSVFWSRFKFW